MTGIDLLTWLAGTSLTATALAAVIMATRGPLTRLIGAQGTALLWSIPAIRVVMPPLPRIDAAPATPAEAPPILADAAYAAYVPIGETVAPMALISNESLVPSLAILALMVWAVGVFWMLSRAFLVTRHWERTVLSDARDIPDTLQFLARDCAKAVGLSRQPTLCLSGATDMPQVIGAFSPTIILPDDFMVRYLPAEQRHALLHEMVHVRRKDILFAWLATMVVAIQWFNPVAHWAMRLFRIDQETACDEAVRALGVPCQDYARTLVKAARLQMAPATVLTLNHGLQERLKRLALPIPSQTVRRRATAGIAILALVGATSTAGTFTVSPPTDTTEAAPKTEERRVYVIRTMDADGNLVTERIEGDDPPGMPVTGQSISITETDNKVKIVTTTGDEPIVLTTDNSGNMVKRTLRIEVGGDGKQGKQAFAWSSTDNEGFYLVGNPFAEIAPPPVAPPAPPAPPVVSVSPAPPPPQKVEGGQWVFIPDAPNMSGFEESMEVFEGSMKAFEGTMEAFGTRMGNIGSTIGDLSTQCDAHQARTGKPTLLRQTAESTDVTVRALCIGTGEDRPSAEEITRFIDRQSALSADEKKALKDESAGR